MPQQHREQQPGIPHDEEGGGACREKREPLHFDRQHKVEADFVVGDQGGKGEQDGLVEIEAGDLPVKDHRPGGGEDDPAIDVNVHPKGTPGMVERSSHGEQQHDANQG